MPVPVTPVRGQLLHLGWSGTPIARITWDERCYLVPWRDGTLLVGATVEDAGFDERTTVAGVRQLLDAVCDLLPERVDGEAPVGTSGPASRQPGSAADHRMVGASCPG